MATGHTSAVARRLLATAAAIVLLVGGILVPRASAANHAPIVVNGTAPTAQTEDITLLAGDSDAVVFERHPVWAAGLTHDLLSARLVAKTATGTHAFGYANYFNRNWSLSGTLLTADRRIRPSQARNGLKYGIDWWNIDTGEHGLFIPPSGWGYLSAAPGGIVATNGAGVLDLLKLNGSQRVLGNPFGGLYVEHVLPGPDGLVAIQRSTTGDSLAYIPWDDSSSVTTLDDGGTLALPNCTGATSSVVACMVFESGSQFGKPVPALIPLNGAAATLAPLTTDNPACLPYSAIAGGDLVYIDSDGCGTVTGPKIKFLAAGSSTPIDATVDPSLPVGVLGPLTDGPDGAAIALGTAEVALATPSAVAPYVGTHQSPTTVADFAVTGHRIVYADDGPRPSHDTSQLPVRSRNFSVRHGRVHLRRAHNAGLRTVSASPYQSGLAAHGTTTAYSEHRHVIVYRNGHRKTYKGGGDVLGIGKRWVAVNTGSSITAINLATGKTTPVANLTAHTNYLIGAYPGGDFVAVSNGRKITWHDLRNGHVRTVCNKCNGPVYASGHWVGFSRNHLRQMRHGGSTVTLTHPLIGLGPQGALLAKPGALQAGNGTVWLRSYSGRTNAILTGKDFFGLPDVAGNVVTWVDEHGDLNAKALPPVH
jgi:hypothetical protein